MNKEAILKRMKEIAEEIIKTGADVNALETEANELRASLEKFEKRDKLLNEIETRGNVTPIEKPDDEEQTHGIHAEPKSNKKLILFKNFADQLAAIKRQAETGMVDERQAKIDKEFRALGMNEGTGADGGFAVQTDFAGLMMDSAVKAGNILPLVDKYEVSGNSNSLKWVDIDETSVATTVFGGVQVYWGSEASQVTAKKPQLIERKMELERLMGVAYATYELDSDSNFISQLYQKAFTIAITRELENCVINGTGAGKPLGILKSSALVSVAKEAGQAASTVMYENMVKMYNRALDKSSSAWVIHPDVQEQLDFMSFPVGVGGVPVYLPASSQGALATLKGRPIVESDQCSALGTLGDINFVDLAQYMLITKGGVQSDVSIHVQFLTAENCFRFIFRANGMPKKNTALTIKNSSNTRSSIVSLATRA